LTSAAISAQASNLVSTETIAKQKAQEHLNSILEEFDKTRLKDFAKITKDLGLEIYQTPLFNRGQYLPKIGISKEFQEAAFQLSEEDKISEVIETPSGFCILYLDSYIPVEESEFEKQKEDIAQSLLNERYSKALNDYLSHLRLKANLVNNIPSKENNQ